MDQINQSNNAAGAQQGSNGDFLDKGVFLDRSAVTPLSRFERPTADIARSSFSYQESTWPASVLDMSNPTRPLRRSLMESGSYLLFDVRCYSALPKADHSPVSCRIRSGIQKMTGKTVPGQDKEFK
jgi:hypothetical protein